MTDKQVVKVTGNVVGSKPTISGTLRTRSALAVQHLRAAVRFTRMCGSFERDHKGESFGNFFEEGIAYASATIMLSVASLEANINEHLSDFQRDFLELSERQLKAFSQLIVDNKNMSILDKYQYALAFKDKDQFEEGKNPYQDAASLIKLRNALVHFKPEWIDELKEHERIEKCLQSCFNTSPFYSGPLFPYGCMSYGCAKWRWNLV